MLNMPTSSSPERGCGKRAAGGVYAETLTGPYGHPIEEYLIDPPYLVDAPTLGLTPVGVKLVEMPNRQAADGTPVHWIWDWVGAGYYPNPADFVEEARLYGASRRLPKNLDWSLITPETRLVLVHSRAGIVPGSGTDRLGQREATFPTDGAHRYRFDAMAQCPQEIGHGHCHRPLTPHADREGTACARYLWQTLLKGEPAEPGAEGFPLVKRALGDTSYLGLAETDPPLDPKEYRPAIFLRLPVHRVVVIEDTAGGSHAATMERVERAGVPVELLPE